MPLPNPFAFDFLPARRGGPSEAGGSAGSPSPTGGDAPEQEPGGLIHRFLRSLQSEETRRGYERDLESFFNPYRLVKGKERITEKDLQKVTREEIMCFLYEQRQYEGYSKNTIRHRATALRSFFKWLEKHGHVEELPFGREEGSTQLMKAALKAGGEDPGTEDPAKKDSGEKDSAEKNPNREAGTSAGQRIPKATDQALENGSEFSMRADPGERALPLETLLLEFEKIPSDLLEISPWIRQAIDAATSSSPEEEQISFSLQDLPMTVYLPFQRLPEVVYWALRFFSQLTEKARQKGRASQLKMLGISHLDGSDEEHLWATVRHFPDEYVSREGPFQRTSQRSGDSQTSGSSQTSGCNTEVWAGIRQTTLRRIESEGPDSRFTKWPVMEMLAALHAQDWILPTPLHRQLQRMVGAPLEQSGQGENRLPNQAWHPAGSEAVWEQVATEVTATLENAFRVGREDTLSLQFRSRS